MIDSDGTMAVKLLGERPSTDETLIDGTNVSAYSQRDLTLYTANRAIEAVQESQRARREVKAVETKVDRLQEDLGSLLAELSDTKTKMGKYEGGLEAAITRGMNTRELKAYRAQKKRRDAIMIVAYGAIFAGIVYQIGQLFHH